MTDRLAVVAIGGNSLIKDPDHPQTDHQWTAIRQTCDHIATMLAQGWRVVLTHGNGPQVGFMLRRSELAAHEVHPLPLDISVACTQGQIGYMLQQALTNATDASVATVVTQVLVDRHDSAFHRPTKPIGGYLTPEKAREFEAEGWTVVDDSGRGLRRVVASPVPQQILEADIIQMMVNQGMLVIAVGGGGVPVTRNDAGELRSAQAVIDKDRASALLAVTLNADLFVISTAVERVALHFNTPQQQWLDHMSADEACRYMEQGHFAEGSMRPKIEAVVSFVNATGNRAIITDPAHIGQALREEAGTHITGGDG